VALEGQKAQVDAARKDVDKFAQELPERRTALNQLKEKCDKTRSVILQLKTGAQQLL